MVTQPLHQNMRVILCMIHGIPHCCNHTMIIAAMLADRLKQLPGEGIIDVHMTWTSTKPTIGGWYFYREPKEFGSDAGCLCVYQGRDGLDRPKIILEELWGPVRWGTEDRL